MRGKAIDLTGQVFGRLTVLDRAGTAKCGAAMWRCRCECGAEKVVMGSSLRNGNTLSCGCLLRERTTKVARQKKGPEAHQDASYTAWKNPANGYPGPEKRRVIAELRALRDRHGRGWAAAVMESMGRIKLVPVEEVLGLANGTSAPKMTEAQWRALDRVLHKLMMTEGGNIVERKD